MAARTLSVHGGTKLEAKLREIAERLGSSGSVSVGFLEGATYPPTEEHPDADGLPVATVAFWNEFGREGQVPRPFFRRMIADKSPEWGDALGKIAKATNYDGPQTLALMGEGIKGQLQESITTFSDPPLRPYTIAKKGFAKPLVDTGVMLRAVDYEVSDGDGT